MAYNQDNSVAKPFTRHSSFAAVDAEIEKANQEPGGLESTRLQTTNPARSPISIASTDQRERSQSSRRSSRSDSQIPEVTMPPPPQKEDDGSHLRLLEELDIHSVPKPFRNPHWKHNQRRNKNIKQILSDVSRKEASTMATQENSGAATPLPEDTVSSTDGESTPVSSAGNALLQPNLAQASRSLSKMVLEKNTKSSGLLPMAPTATYTNIAAGPSLTHQKRYCDITGLPTTYRDPKTGLRYYNAEIYAVVKSLGPGVAEQYLEARGAHTILK